MENVKGMLSASVEGAAIIEMVLEDLRRAGGCSDSYVLVPLSGISKNAANSAGREFVVRSEDYGVPQSRHRVIILGVRADLAAALDPKVRRPVLEMEAFQTVGDALKGLPPLRSGLSKGASNSPDAWREAAVNALCFAAAECANFGQSDAANYLTDAAARIRNSGEVPPRECDELGKPGDGPLAQWYSDPRLRSLRNHEARGHMDSDLARYAFVAAFAKLRGRSPKASDFSPRLAPSHANWKSGKFADRFRAQRTDAPSSTITSHISKDGHYFIHPDPLQCRSLTVREAARLQTFPDNYLFEGNRTQQYVQVGNAVPPLLAHRIAKAVYSLIRGAVDQAAVSSELRNVA
jgi:DNA (cytosine-5)-methyltransferase 1